ncbi:MAG: hypothetical protein HKP58_14540 [Desulfatitalea sp.]|nr:hypothetical protein [Desulfatitalea sp.]NNK01624.1 hypothetical protein [Desulfatitalea sp.]
MEISAISTNSAATAAARQLSANAAMQTKVMKQLAESQQQMADLLAQMGIGQNLDASA